MVNFERVIVKVLNLLQKNQNRGGCKNLVLGLIFIAGILFSGVLPSLVKPAVSQETNHMVISSLKLPNQNKQDITEPPKNLGEALLQQVVLCVAAKFPNPRQTSVELLQAASTQCVFQVVILAPDGSVRQDASDRLTALVEVSGVSLPEPVSRGQANVQLKTLPDSQVFTLPVQIGGQTKTFLLDTGASSSIINAETAQQLALPSTPIPSDILKYIVVGDKCAEVKANLHPLPIISVDAATVQGLNGMGLPPTSIPGNLSGVLGLDFLSNFDVVLNPKTLQVQFLRPSIPVGGAIPLAGKLGNITAQVRINGRGPFTFMLDTGADAIVLSKNLAERLSLNSINAQETEVFGFCGAQKAKQIKLDSVSLGQYEVNHIDSAILNSNIFNLLGVDGIIGQSFLNKYQQHWRFGKRNAIGFIESGSLVLTPLAN
ncbi:retroviral-like aspartic protease family protein [Aerosakkonema sp. BLCC-F2]